MRSSPLRPCIPGGSASIALASILAVLWPAPAVAADGGRHATTSAPALTALSLTGPAAPVGYGRTASLVARLTSAGKPVSNRRLDLFRAGASVASGTTNSDGRVRFRLKAVATGTYEAHFAPAPPDAPLYQPAVSSPLQVTVQPRLALKLSSALHSRRVTVGIPRQRLRVSGTLAPFAAGSVVVRILRGGREVRRATRPVTQKDGRGRFGLDFRPGVRGKYTIRAQTSTGASTAKRLLVVRPSAHEGSRGPAVRALQSRLSALGYPGPVNGSFNGTTARSVLAFRKVNGISRTTSANRAVFRTLERGGGGFRLRFPNAGKHVEFDWSRQVLVLARGASPVRILHASSGKPSTPTVFGTFHFYSKTAGFNSHGMYFSNYFVGGYAIHGYASVPPYAASHGCIRIPIPSAISVYRWVDIGDRISVYR